MSTFRLGRRVLVSSAAIAALLGWAGLSSAQDRKNDKPADKPTTIIDVAKTTGMHKTFVKLVESAGLTEALTGKGEFTVFAPTDEAFDKLGKEKLDDLMKPANKAKLQEILKHHVVAKRMNADHVKQSKTIKPMAGGDLTISVKDKDVWVGKAKITKTDVNASNGIIHVVDAVIMPTEGDGYGQGGARQPG